MKPKTYKNLTILSSCEVKHETRFMILETEIKIPIYGARTVQIPSCLTQSISSGVTRVLLCTADIFWRRCNICHNSDNDGVHFATTKRPLLMATSPLCTVCLICFAVWMQICPGMFFSSPRSSLVNSELRLRTRGLRVT